MKLLTLQQSSNAAKSIQSCPTLCDPIDGSPPGFPNPGILQARTLEWVTISLSNAWKWKVKVKLLSHVCLFATPWTASYQAPPFMGFSRQEYWSGVPLPSPKVAIDNAYMMKHGCIPIKFYLQNRWQTEFGLWGEFGDPCSRWCVLLVCCCGFYIGPWNILSRWSLIWQFDIAGVLKPILEMQVLRCGKLKPLELDHKTVILCVCQN